MMRRAPLALLALLLCAAAATPASAGTTIGVIGPPSPHTGKGGVIGLSPGPAYRVPAGGGIITSWTVNGVGEPRTPEALTALKIFQTSGEATGGRLSATVIAGSRLVSVPDGAGTFSTRIPVSGGEQIGVFFPEPGPLFTSGPESTACFAPVWGENGDTFTQGQTMTCESSRGVNVAARIEPDADEDGFGDETQDGCPGVRARAAGCHPRYRGRGQGRRPFELRFGYRDGGVSPYSPGPGPVIEDMRFQVKLQCPDGYSEELIIYGGIDKRLPIYVKPDSTFEFGRGMAQGDGILGGHTKIKGRLTGPTAHGTASTALKYRHHGICKSGRYTWRILSR